MKRDFKGVWIPKEIWLNENLTWSEKLMFIEINSLDNGKNRCFASNDYFSKFFNLSVHRISNIINALIQKKYVLSKMEKTKTGNRRILRISKLAAKGKVKGGVDQKVKGGVDQKVKTYKSNNKETNNKVSGSNEPSLPHSGLQKKEGFIQPKHFEEFWNLYPKTPNPTKAKSKIIWNKICKLPKQTEQTKRPKWKKLQKIIKQQIQSERWQYELQNNNGQKIPRCQTWLNQHRWEDEISEMQKYEDFDKNNHPNQIGITDGKHLKYDS